jgi:hypothetical protein
MFSTKNIIVEVDQVPSYWVFRYYLGLSEQLSGQDIKIKSLWNSTERTPSMCIYVNKLQRQYLFKDFSTGKYGNKITLVMELFNLDYASACDKLVYDYNAFIKNQGKESIEFNMQSKWELDFINPREWNTLDSNYWLGYRIGKSILEEYNVKPLEYYTMIKDEDGNISKLKIEGKHIYAYCDKDGNPYKIYQPFKKKHKFHKLKSHIQGIDQLKYNQPYLVICSSLKDAMCLKGFGYNVEVIAPDSENCVIKPYIIENLKEKYKKIITLFDNDNAGHNAIEKYAKTYNINGTALTICKDISDAIKEYGFEVTHSHLKPLLKQALYKP